MPKTPADHKTDVFKITGRDITLELAENSISVRCNMHVHLPQDGGVLELYSYILPQRIVLEGKDLHKEDYSITFDPATKKQVLRIELAQGLNWIALAIYNTLNPSENNMQEGLFVKDGQLIARGLDRITFVDADDSPAVLQTTIIYTDEDRYGSIVSLGSNQNASDLEDDRHKVVYVTPDPIPSSAFALYCGNFVDCERHGDDDNDENVTDINGQKVKLSIYGRKDEHHEYYRYEDFAPKILNRALAWLEDTFQHGIKVNECNIVLTGELPGNSISYTNLNFMTARSLFGDEETSTVETLANVTKAVLPAIFSPEMRVEYDVIAHWVTHQFMKDLLGPRYLIDFATEVNQAIANNTFNGELKKSAVALTIGNVLGREVFIEAIKHYMRNFDGKHTIVDFIAALEVTSGADLKQLALWYKNDDVPILDIIAVHNPITQQLVLTIHQTKPAQLIPFKFGVIATDHEIIPTRKALLSGETTTIKLDDIPKNFALSVMRDFSAPVKIRSMMPSTGESLELRFAAEPDQFNRVESGQQFITQYMLQMIDYAMQGGTPHVNTDFLDLYRDVFNDDTLDMGTKVKALSIPSLEILIGLAGKVDLEIFAAVRRTLCAEIADTYTLEERLFDLYDNTYLVRPFALTTKGVASVSQVIFALSLLMHLNKQEYIDACIDLATLPSITQDDPNFPAVAAALQLLVYMDYRGKNEIAPDILKLFFNRCIGYNGLLTWFGCQAMSSLTTVYDQLRTIKNGELKVNNEAIFDINDPLQVEALFCTFAFKNSLGFHDANGKGYALIEEFLPELDKVNSAQAVQLVWAFDNWQNFVGANDRAAKMQAVLTRVRDNAVLSDECRSVAKKLLANKPPHSLGTKPVTKKMTYLAAKNRVADMQRDLAIAQDNTTPLMQAYKKYGMLQDEPQDNLQQQNSSWLSVLTCRRC